MVKKKGAKKSSIKSKSKNTPNKNTPNKNSSKPTKKVVVKKKVIVKEKAKKKPIRVSKGVVKWIIGIAVILIIIVLLGKLTSPTVQEAKYGDIVNVMYTGTLDTGEVFDTNIKEIAEANSMTKPGYDPLRFTLGNNQVIAGFEAGILGMHVGENKVIEIESEDAYGEYRSDLLKTIPMEQFKQSFAELPELFKGMELVYSTPEGERGVMYVKSFGQESITLDFNHKLSGKKLIFEVQLVSIAE